MYTDIFLIRLTWSLNLSFPQVANNMASYAAVNALLRILATEEHDDHVRDHSTKMTSCVDTNPVGTFPENLVLGPVEKLGLPMVYKRSVSNKNIDVGQAVGALYGKPLGYLFQSGMQAILMALKVALQKVKFKGVILHGDELYCDTVNKVLLQLSLEHPGVECVPFRQGSGILAKKRAQMSFEEAVEKYKERVRIIYVEAASNPTGHMFNWAQLKLKGLQGAKPLLLVDNTWLTSAGFNPFEVGASIVVESASKYNSAGAVISGLAVAANKRLSGRLERLRATYGVHVSDETADLVGRGLTTLKARMKKFREVTIAVACEMQKITRVYHPCLASHPSHTLFKKYAPTAGPGVFLFLCPQSAATTKDLGHACAKHGVFFATSFGKSVSLVDMWPVQSSEGLWVRVSVGCDEDVPHLVHRLTQICNALSAPATPSVGTAGNEDENGQ